MRGRFCPGARWINSFLLSVNNKIVKGVFDEWGPVRDAPESFGVAFVFGEEQIIRVFTKKPIFA